ncbi:MAG: aminotransferase class V-fold PLP-dependent enzyme [Trebonia sp.]
MTLLSASLSVSAEPHPAVTWPGPLADVVGADLDVPLVTGGFARYVNLDYAASAPALRAVAHQVTELLPLYSSVHRGAGYASAVCTRAYEAARATLASFAGARGDDVVIFTRNTTDALNLLATAVPGAVVHLDIEHHANLLPWRAHGVSADGVKAAGVRGAGARAVKARATVAETLRAVGDELARTPAALLAVTGASNVTGECLPLAELADLAHAHGARIAVDGAQLVPHRRVDLAASGIDYLAFSGHKVYAPFGAGVLVGRGDWLDAAPPYLAGGGAVRQVRLDVTDWATSPARHEGGTPNVIGAVALAAACRFIDSLPAGAVEAHEGFLARRLVSGLAAIDGVRLLRLWPDLGDQGRIGVVTFTVDGWPAQHVAQYLSAEHGIGVRDGRFCAHPLLARLARASAVPDGAAVRASLGLGSRAADVDRLVDALGGLRAHGTSWAYAGAEGGFAPRPDPRLLPDWLAGGPAGPPSPWAG